MKKKLLISTRKGLIIAEKTKASWKITESHFDAIPVTICYEDPRNGHWWVGLDHGHWGIKLHYSKNKGINWTELEAPKYSKGTEIKPGIEASTSYIWSIHHGGSEYPESLFIGTIPGGLFETKDYGKNWELNLGLWNHESRMDHWFGGGFDHPGIHSINVNPENSDKIMVGVSCGGVFETMDRGLTWLGRNKGLIADFLPNKNAEYGHDPHLLVRCPSDARVLWQQNHCGIFRSANAGKTWNNVSQENGPAYFGFAMAVAEDNADEAWVVPAISDERRIPLDKSLSICKTVDGGKSWSQITNGLPQESAFDIVYRHALATSGNTVVFGSTTGNVFISEDRGESWQVLSNYLPMVHAICFAD